MIQNGDCYFTRECEALGVPVLVTPCPSFKAQGIEDGVNGYYIDFDMSNLDVEKIYNNIPQYEEYIQEDRYKEILINKKSNYKEELKMRFKVKATNKYKETNTFDGELSREKGVAKYYPEEGEEWIVSKERADILVEKGFVTIVEEIFDDMTKEERTEDPIKEPKKVTKKRTKKVSE